MCNINTETDNPAATISLCNIYGPNADTPGYYKSIFDSLSEYTEKKLIIGDFNLTLQPEIDRYRSEQKTTKAANVLKELMEEHYLTDVWRDRNPNTMRFSWTKRNPRLLASRIDFALVSRGLDKITENCTYLQSILTDHSAFYLSINPTDGEKRGPGYWKMNCELLRQKATIEKIGTKIDELLGNLQKKSIITDWDQFKTDIAKYCQNLSRTNADDKKIAISQLCEKVNEYEENFPLEETDLNLYEQSKLELEELSREKARNCMFRSKVRWYEEGEKNTKYFYNLEKARYNSKSSSKIIRENGETVTGKTNILNEQFEYYQKLYSKDENVKFNIRNETNVYLSTDNIEICGVPFTKTDVANAVKEQKNGKTPGDDGLPAEFYKVYWQKLAPHFLCLMETCLEENSLPQSTRNGTLNLIPKPGKDSRLLKNLRPITLLNVDYKIIEKTIAAKLDRVLPEIINRDQSGFMAGRRIATSIRKVYDLLEFTKWREEDIVLMNLDFVKCFDKISFDCIINSLRYFNFPEYIVNWVNLLYSEFSVRIQNNGYFTDKIAIEKSVHQGGCCSVQLFLVCAEIIAIELRQCRDIRGLNIGELIYLLNQYADDMNVASKYEENSINAIFSKFKLFKDNTGFTLNYDKTSILRTGSLHKTNAQLYTMDEIAWTDDPIEVLGITVGYGEEVVHRNYAPLLDKTKATLGQWINRGLSLYGKINIVNTLVASLFVYKMTVLPKMSDETIKKLESEINSFLWNGRKAKIKLRTLQTHPDSGGAKLVNFHAKDASLKISWIKTLRDEEKLANMVYQFFAKDLLHDFWRCNLRRSDVQNVLKKDVNSFWFDVISAWTDYHYVEDNEHASRFLWLNSLIRIDDKPFFWPKCYKRGLTYPHQLLNADGQIDIEESMEKYGLTMMQLNGLIAALPKSWKIGMDQIEVRDTKLEELLEAKKAPALVYNKLVTTEDILDRLKVKWSATLGQDITRKYIKSLFKNIKCVSVVPKLRSFQYRLLHGALVLNRQLFLWKIKSSEMCSFCDSEVETIQHLMVECRYVKGIWNRVKELCIQDFNTHINTEGPNILFDSVAKPRKNVCNFICLVVKQYIYRKRCIGERPTFNEVNAHINRYRNIEKYIAIKNDKVEYHCKKWKCTDMSAQNLDTYVENYLNAS